MNPSSAFSHQRPLIEPLEQRIAPALLVTGANLLGGAGNPTTGETSIGGHNVTLVQVLSGEAIVWFDHHTVDAISVGPNTSLSITGDVGVDGSGAIVANLTASGQLSDSDNNPSNGLDGDVLLPNNILSITTHPLAGQLGSIGAIITGGSVSNLNISGTLGGGLLGGGVYAGTGVFRAASIGPNGAKLPGSHLLEGGEVVVPVVQSTGLGLDLNPIMPGVQGSFVFSAGNAKTVSSGAPITNVKVGAADGMQVFAGNGFDGKGKPGLPGGSISNVTIESAFLSAGSDQKWDSYSLMAGNGGSGTSGGAGGSVQKIIEITSAGTISIVGGNGGSGLSGAGGAGGSLKGLDMQSDSSSYTVMGGKGGTGAPGGPGGSVTGVNFAGDTPTTGIILHAPFTGGVGTADDVLIVDSGSGNMVLEQNINGVGSGFLPVIQDINTGLSIIQGDGTTPVAAAVVYLNGTAPGALPDIIVAYKNSSNLAVYTNEGGGLFTKKAVSPTGVFTDSPNAISVALPYSPTKIAVGNFTGSSGLDVAVLASTPQVTNLMTVEGSSAGAYSVLNSVIPLEANATDIVATGQGLGLNDLIVGFKTGDLTALVPTGSAVSPFNIQPTGIILPNGIANLDYDIADNELLALNGNGTTLNLYSVGSGGGVMQTGNIPVASEAGIPLVAHFIPGMESPEQVEVLSSVGGGSRLNVWSLDNGIYAVSGSVQTPEILKNFVPVIDVSGAGVATLTGSLGHFAFSQSDAQFYDVALPFVGKTVLVTAGNGGDGIDVGHLVGKAGAGGMISGINVQADIIGITGGSGGFSQNGAAGAGGMVSDGTTLVTVTGKTLSPEISAVSKLEIFSGSGGSADGTVHTATGGAGGLVTGLHLTMLTGEIDVTAEGGGSGGGGAGGNGGTVSNLKTVNDGGDLVVVAGGGGAASGSLGNGGEGGSILNLTHALTPQDPLFEQGYNVTLTSGTGGASVSGIGGMGGAIGIINLTLTPAQESVSDPISLTLHANIDSTVRVTMTAGSGGNGSVGGAGGYLKTINTAAIFDQTIIINGATFSEVNPVAAQLTAGDGGKGSKGAGGAGGSVSSLLLQGISYYDQDPINTQAGQSPLIIKSGNGGDGATIGGAGGAILGVISENAGVANGSGAAGNLDATELNGATIISGNGGNGHTLGGGAGGTVGTLNIGVSGRIVPTILNTTGQAPDTTAYPIIFGGSMNIQSGAGGNGGALGKGGAAGNISSSLLGTVDVEETYGLLLQGGTGGNGGAGGGSGGSVTGIQFNAPQNPEQAVNGAIFNSYDALTTAILAGNGGAATGASGVGGVGGCISQISESKDVNSTINVLQAGNGGAALGTGGAGGSVTAVKSVGSIGQASDDFGNSFGAFQTFTAPGVFDTLFPGSATYGVPEGVFAGRGGTGVTNGAPGSVTFITAAQIAAIGATVDANGLFAAAAKVANITAQVIGYDVSGNGVYDNVTGPNPTPPDQAVAIDGFIFSRTALTAVNTQMSPALLEAFTFISP